MVICLSLEKCLFRSSAQCVIGVFVFLLLSCMSCLYILEIEPCRSPHLWILKCSFEHPTWPYCFCWSRLRAPPHLTTFLVGPGGTSQYRGVRILPHHSCAFELLHWTWERSRSSPPGWWWLWGCWWCFSGIWPKECPESTDSHFFFFLFLFLPKGASSL